MLSILLIIIISTTTTTTNNNNNNNIIIIILLDTRDTCFLDKPHQCPDLSQDNNNNDKQTTKDEL